jgi:hypothetical protein
MTARSIIEMRDAHPRLFCPQDWYLSETFAHIKLTPLIGPPSHLVRCTLETAPAPDDRTDAMLLVDLYLRDPHDAWFHGPVLCADFTSRGEEVYIGNTANGRGLEIHRILKDTQFSVPVWR